MCRFDRVFIIQFPLVFSYLFLLESVFCHQLGEPLYLYHFMHKSDYFEC
jgi:hypothetical protein